MNERKPKSLDEAFAALPRDVPPSRDLWPDIQKQLHDVPAERVDAPRFAPRRFQWAAVALLMVGASVLTYVVTKQTAEQPPAVAMTGTPATPESATSSESLGPTWMGAEYMTARNDLTARFEARVATLPAEERAKLESSLADLRLAAEEVSAILAKHPSDPLLQQLLVSTYRSELQLLAGVTDMNTTENMP